MLRMTRCLSDKSESLTAGRRFGQALRAIIAQDTTARTAVDVAALMADDAKVEIEATAVVPD